jgi:hypothetical protein
MHWLFHEDWLLLLDVNLLVLDWLLDIDVLFNMLMYDIALAKTIFSIAIAMLVLASAAYYTTVLFRELLFLLEQFSLSLLFFTISLFLCAFLLSESLFLF